MAALISLNISILLVFCFVALTRASHISHDERKSYIVYLGSPAGNDQSSSSHHFRVLQEVVDSRFVGQSLLRSYTRSFNGFAAYVTPQEREKLANHEEVVSIFPSTTLYPQTTRSWDFVGLTKNVHRNFTVESDIIIGVIDTGIWPESESFDDKGFGPPPKKWKGACQGGQNFTCNNKLIGARYYVPLTDDTARDHIGHGTHTASIAAGNYVKHASFYGIAEGTARGAVPSARIAAYRVCDENIGCDTTAILAAFDDAIADGVDIITISIGSSYPFSLKDDVIAQGALHASQKGILVVQSAGNNEDKYTVVSTVPWIFSVAASSIDRAIFTKVALGDGTILNGKAVNSFKLRGTSLPLVYGKDASHKCNANDARNCADGCLDTSLVKGKIVLCSDASDIKQPFRAGAAGLVMKYEIDVSVVFPLAMSAFNSHDFNLVESYYNNTKYPKANILTSNTARNLDAPRVASFSSKGPNFIIPDILKPDISAPGLEILAAFSPLAPPSYNYPYDHRSVKYDILSGTSMACPHVTGLAAYVKSFHPDWSASAIKSAIMTTARKMDPIKHPLAEFAFGAGHIDPLRALHPGLVYDTLPADYIKVLCSLGNDTAALTRTFHTNITCQTGAHTTLPPKDLNYPSMTSIIKTNGSKVVSFSRKFTRIVTNVEPGKRKYKVKTSKSSDYKIKVKPRILKFRAKHEKKSFQVIIKGKFAQKMVSASLEWSDGVHRVHSPIVLYRDDL